ncbi:MAG: hypothetical protein ACKPKO_21430, partial [Candidatus Fonsibacter sp.]
MATILNKFRLYDPVRLGTHAQHRLRQHLKHRLELNLTVDSKSFVTWLCNLHVKGITRVGGLHIKDISRETQYRQQAFIRLTEFVRLNQVAHNNMPLLCNRLRTLTGIRT